MSAQKTILFLGATGGCGFSTLRRSLAAGHTCIALCRTPSKLSARLNEGEQRTLRLEQGNAHDVDALMRCLINPIDPQGLVDMVVFSIGGLFNFAKMTIDDPNVCERGISALLEALKKCRAKTGRSGSNSPRVVVLSTTGISDVARDVPLLLFPMYHIMLKDPHKDKRAMERALAASDEAWTVVRPSLLTDGPETDKPIRAGMEDPAGGRLESKAIGYTISREDVGKWIFENLVQEADEKWVRKAATITY
ncbi:hypothetical protein QBC46DRAFT_398143 [Diplogelasinospora grovesii]|uniref:NAD(P)-binding domain-containing protein n=1 Tax=Diplogelasinospora grovesii TaxID=303347 RepID=A0AAN6MX89_9PEZI|nr:hypothetical protein QBC46DRAFT_398143 [Diplogelasinospora grovesii]